MKNIYSYLFISVIACIPNCLSGQCTANFTFEETNLNIQFNDLSSAGPNDTVISWLWDFEDGTTSTFQNPSHTFSEPGIYDVLLIITTANGCTSEFEVRIEICAFSVDLSIGQCNPDGTVDLAITVNDLFDNAGEINLSIDGQIIPGSPFEIDEENPVNINYNLSGDGLNHLLVIQSVDIGTCSKSLDFALDDCSSDCFLSGLSTSVTSGITHTVEIGDNFFNPVTSTIIIGDLVRFNWSGDGHSTTSDANNGPDSWNSGEIDAGSVFDVLIITPGIHPFYCIPHGGPGGVGMSGSIVANCPENNQVGVKISFQASQTNPAGYNIYFDGTLISGSPFTYNGIGTQNLTLDLAGDGLTHTIVIEDISDPTCTLSTQWQAPDCGATPTCSLSITATENGACDINNEVPVDLQITAVNPGNQGFNLLIDGTSAGTFTYDPSGTTNVNINLSGDGNSHDIQVIDLAQNNCTASTSIITTNCSIPCSINNLNVLNNQSTIHTVNVEDFTFTPKDITITEGDIVDWQWTGSIAHTSTSDATSGPDAWDSGLLSTGASFLSPVLSVGIHPYYCIPHGGPGGQGMSGTITVQPDCTNGMVSVSVQFQHSGGSFNGFILSVDNVQQGTYAYDPSGNTTINLSIPGDGQNHSIQILDADDPSCSASTSLTTTDCNALPCQLSLTAQETGNCDANDQVNVQIGIEDNGGGDNGFEVFVDGTSAGTFTYDPSGTTNVNINLSGDGNSHDIQVVDLAQNTCSATTSIVTTNCTIPCSISNLNVLDNQSTIHTVNVEDFTFAPKDITITEGDIVDWQWTGSIAHTSTSDATSGPDAWDSDLLSTGASFQSPVLSVGIHPYYCIPHGGPGGQGMSGTITVQPDCTNGMVSVSVQFHHSGGSFNGFILSVDNVQQGTYDYDPSGTSTLNFSIPGDGQSHTIQILDADDPSCSASTSLTTTDCNALPCQLSLTAQETGNCDANDQVNVQIGIEDNGGGDNGFEVFVDGTSAGTFTYDPSGTTNVNINLSGDGNSHDIQVIDLAQNNCTASTSIITTDCAPPCSISLSSEQLSICEDSLVNFLIIINAIGQGAQFEVLLDGTLIPENPFEYQGTTTSVNIDIPGDGNLHEIEIRDVQQADCSANIFLSTPDCESACGFTEFQYTEHVPTTHTIEVQDFTFTPEDITVEVGDTILWVWTGEIPHTTTSDTIEGPDSWNSGLLGQGAEFSIVIQEEGFHPYYCIPHGSPGGIGMAGTITAEDICADEQLNAGFTFEYTNVGLNGYQVTIDGNPVVGSPFAYNSNDPNIWTTLLPANGQQIALIISDVDDTSCRLDTLIQMPACNDPCFGFTADFSIQIDHSNLQTTFTSNTTEAQQWLWTFGDGNSSTEENPQHQYAATGEYEVCLEVQNDIDCISQTCTTIFVGAFICQADFDYETEGLTIQFLDLSNSSDSISNWTWDFGDGFLQEGIANPTYTYDSLGVYEVCLNIEADNCQTDTCMTLDLSDPCLTFEAAFDFSTNADHSIQFLDLTGAGANQWLWGFGDGQTSNEQFPTHHYTEVGTYNVCLLVQDTLRACNSALCSTIDILITDVEQAPTSLRLYSFPNPVLAGQNIYFQGIPSAVYGQSLSWSMVDLQGRLVDQGDFTATERAALAVPRNLAPGIYHIRIIGEDRTYWVRLVVQ